MKIDEYPDIPCGLYFLTRDDDGRITLWSNDQCYKTTYGRWFASGPNRHVYCPVCYEGLSLVAQWRKLLGRRTFGIPKGGCGWIEVYQKEGK